MSSSATTATGSISAEGKTLIDVDAFGVTDTGKTRKVNEDQFLIASLSKSMLVRQTSLPGKYRERLVGTPRGTLLAVADGMGGHGGGDVASALAVDVILHYVLHIMPWFLRLDESYESDLTDELRAALDSCQVAVQNAAEAKDSEHPLMGTTLTIAYVVWPRLYVVHVGDSRAYLFRGGELQLITEDHTLAQKMVDRDMLDEKGAQDSRWSNVLWNSVGGGSDQMEPDVYKAKLERGDVVLLCTDGLTKHIDDDGIREMLTDSDSDAQHIAGELVDVANEAGGSDNVTAVVARFSQE